MILYAYVYNTHACVRWSGDRNSPSVYTFGYFFSTSFCDAWTSKLSFSIFLTSLPLCFLPLIITAPSGSTERQVAKDGENLLCTGRCTRCIWSLKTQLISREGAALLPTHACRHALTPLSHMLTSSFVSKSEPTKKENGPFLPPHEK